MRVSEEGCDTNCLSRPPLLSAGTVLIVRRARPNYAWPVPLQDSSPCFANYNQFTMKVCRTQAVSGPATAINTDRGGFPPRFPLHNSGAATL